MLATREVIALQEDARSNSGNYVCTYPFLLHSKMKNLLLMMRKLIVIISSLHMIIPLSYLTQLRLS